MSNLLGFNTSISTCTNNPSKPNTTLSFFNGDLQPTILTIPIMPSSSLIFFTSRPPKFTKKMFSRKVGCVQVEEQAAEVEIAEGYTMTKFCDKIIDLFLNEKPRVKDWRKYLVFREDWNKYRDSFYDRCHTLAMSQTDSVMKQKIISLGRKVKRIDDEMERHTELLKEIEGSPLDINAIVSKRRKDFTEEFFRHLTLLSETYDGLEDRDAVARLGARCLAAVGAYDNTIEIVDTMDSAQAKFDDILNSPSVEEACEKINSLAKAKELDSSLILLINSAWATAKESTTMKNEILRSDSLRWLPLFALEMTMRQEIRKLYTQLPRSCTSGSRLCWTHTTFIKKILRSGKPSR